MHELCRYDPDPDCFQCPCFLWCMTPTEVDAPLKLTEPTKVPLIVFCNAMLAAFDNNAKYVDFSKGDNEYWYRARKNANDGFTVEVPGCDNEQKFFLHDDTIAIMMQDLLDHGFGREVLLDEEFICEEEQNEQDEPNA